MLLKDSLGGGAKTCMFANVSPADCNVSETVSTLRFADRAKQIKNKPKIQMDPKDQRIADLQAQVAELQEKMAAIDSGDFDAMTRQIADLKSKNEQLESKLEQIGESGAAGFGAAEGAGDVERELRGQLVLKDQEIEKLKKDLEKRDKIIEELKVEAGVDHAMHGGWEDAAEEAAASENTASAAATGSADGGGAGEAEAGQGKAAPKKQAPLLHCS
eukprot:gene7794-7232_t